MRFPILGPAIFFNGLYLLLYPASSRRRCCWHIGGEKVSMYTVSNSDCATTLDGGGGARCDDDFALRRKKWWLGVSKGRREIVHYCLATFAGSRLRRRHRVTSASMEGGGMRYIANRMSQKILSPNILRFSGKAVSGVKVSHGRFPLVNL